MLQAFKANVPVIVLISTDSAAGTRTEMASLKHDAQTTHFPAERAHSSEAPPTPGRRNCGHMLHGPTVIYVILNCFRRNTPSHFLCLPLLDLIKQKLKNEIKTCRSCSNWPELFVWFQILKKRQHAGMEEFQNSQHQSQRTLKFFQFFFQIQIQTASCRLSLRFELQIKKNLFQW